MAWSQSGLYTGSLSAVLGRTGGTFDWLAATNKAYLTGVGDTPNYTQAVASAIYSVTNEVTSTANWPAGGVAFSALAAGGSLTPTLTASGSNVMTYGAQNISIASTTIATAAWGMYLYSTAATANYKYIGIWFGGSGYTTSAGTFAVTWASNVIATVTCS